MRRSFLFALALVLPLHASRAQITETEYASRRAALAAKAADGVILALGAPEPEENFLSFYQSPRFLYLTGWKEPDAALVMVKRGAQVTSTLFVQPNNPAQEVWTGARAGVAGATRRTGLPAREYAALRPMLDSLLGAGMPLSMVMNLAEGGTPAPLDRDFVRDLRAQRSDLAIADLSRTVDELRGHKSAAELALIRKAVDITVIAQREAMLAVEPGQNEFETQALIEYTFRRNGADRPSFSTITGSGPNATTLHYNVDDRFTNPGDVMVMDIGASYRGYAADVTRTVPVSGTYTADQRTIYQIVRDAQAAGERQAKLGAPAKNMGDSAAAVIAAGLTKLGLIESATATYDCGPDGARTCPQYRLYYMHGLGHGIGLDVHDPDQYYTTGVIAPGSAFTIEPGIYVRANTVDILPKSPRNQALGAKIRAAVERYANIGIRIEDDYIATESGVEWISRAPREASEIEALMKQTYAGPARRDPSKLDWYRQSAGSSNGGGAGGAGRAPSPKQ